MTNPTPEERLAAHGLPDPLDPTRLTIHDWRTATIEIGNSPAARDVRGLTQKNTDARLAVTDFLFRVELVRNLMAGEGEQEVVKAGTADDDEYGWEIVRAFYGSRSTAFPWWFVKWTDFVANDWIQIVRDRSHADAFLAALEACADSGLPVDWEEGIPSTFSTVDCSGWSVITQITATVHLAADGSPERVEVPLLFDPEFVIGLTGPGGDDVETWFIHDGDRDPSDEEAAVLGAIKGGEVYAPHI